MPPLSIILTPASGLCNLRCYADEIPALRYDVQGDAEGHPQTGPYLC